MITRRELGCGIFSSLFGFVFKSEKLCGTEELIHMYNRSANNERLSWSIFCECTKLSIQDGFWLRLTDPSPEGWETARSLWGKC